MIFVIISNILQSAFLAAAELITSLSSFSILALRPSSVSGGIIISSGLAWLSVLVSETCVVPVFIFVVCSASEFFSPALSFALTSLLRFVLTSPLVWLNLPAAGISSFVVSPFKIIGKSYFSASLINQSGQSSRDFTFAYSAVTVGLCTVTSLSSALTKTSLALLSADLRYSALIIFPLILISFIWLSNGFSNRTSQTFAYSASESFTL